MNIKKYIVINLIVISIIFLTVACSPAQNLRKESVNTVLSSDGSSITYGVRGQGDIAIVFIHCWTCNHEFWRPQIEHFSNNYKVVWVDLAGHGLSGTNRNAYTMSSFGEDVAAVVKNINADNVILVGHSMGGPVAIEAAKEIGSKVIGIVGVDTFYTPFAYPKIEAEIQEFLKPFELDFKGSSEHMVRSMFTPTANQELVNSIVRQMSVASPDMGVSAMYEIFRWNAKNNPHDLDMQAEKLRNINAAPTGNETALHKSVHLIPGVGHFVAQVKPNEFNRELSLIIDEYQKH